jgi:hypothetical protein
MFGTDIQNNEATYGTYIQYGSETYEVGRIL